MTKKTFVKTGSSKKEQNEVARYLAVRSSDRILYDPKQLLVIDDNNLVEELQVIEDEDLSQFERKLAKCNNESEVEDLCE